MTHIGYAKVGHFVHLLHWLLISMLSSPVHTSCKLSTYKHPRTEPTWHLRVFPNLIYAYGLPVDFIGGVISTVQIRQTSCQLEDQRTFKCMQDAIPRYCHFDQSQMDYLKIHPSVANGTCPFEVLPNMTGAVTSVSADRQLLLIEPAPETKPPQAKYDLLMNRIKGYFNECSQCKRIQSVGGVYICNFAYYMDLFRHKQLEEDEISWDISEKTVLSLYIHNFCLTTWPQLVKMKFSKEQNSFHPFCPNPCSIRLGRCTHTAHTLTPARSPTMLASVSESNCVRVGKGIYAEDYACLCEPGYRWDPVTKSCYPPDICAQNLLDVKKYNLPESELLCSPRGTLKCVSDSFPSTNETLTEEMYILRSRLNARHTCVCRNAFMGVRCDRHRNACVESGLSGGVTGEQACRTYLGNKCISHNGTDLYFCKCTENWMHDTAWSFPNCYKRRSICDRVICRNRGTCIGSEDQKTFICTCEYGWRGRLCEQPDVRQW
ncbi:hypothetical protein FGIG_09168 [Fasciola gigantica]|uniref:EGF-like domain-containing protein n=1 Tax=Fasciola gigantica TaxID=46835 RepID=A0A504YL89_FASGI|nr:hypothetical protein FGIG_09168 [Fasciola gigantica]